MNAFDAAVQVAKYVDHGYHSCWSGASRVPSAPFLKLSFLCFTNPAEGSKRRAAHEACARQLHVHSGCRPKTMIEVGLDVNSFSCTCITRVYTYNSVSLSFSVSLYINTHAQNVLCSVCSSLNVTPRMPLFRKVSGNARGGKPSNAPPEARSSLNRVQSRTMVEPTATHSLIWQPS